jgi:anti-sigma regulatory factor (Ser/Thr protein kinase)
LLRSDAIVPIRRLTIPGRLDAIETACDCVEAGAREAGFDDSTSYACQLAVAEACENIIKHGYSGEGGGEIRLEVSSASGELTIRLEDSAPSFNPARLPSAHPWDQHDPPVGGLGLRIIHRVMDHVSYVRRSGTNRLTMRKRLARTSD